MPRNTTLLRNAIGNDPGRGTARHGTAGNSASARSVLRNVFSRVLNSVFSGDLNGNLQRSRALLANARAGLRRRAAPLALRAAFSAAALCTCAIPAAAHAESPSEAASTGSALLSLISGSVVVGTLAASGEMVVTGIEKVGDSTTIFLRDASNATAQAGAASVQVASSVLQGAGLSVGSTVNAVAEPTGYALMASGRMICYIPNEIGRSLVGSSTTRTR